MGHSHVCSLIHFYPLTVNFTDKMKYLFVILICCSFQFSFCTEKKKGIKCFGRVFGDDAKTCDAIGYKKVESKKCKLKKEEECKGACSWVNTFMKQYSDGTTGKDVSRLLCESGKKKPNDYNMICKQYESVKSTITKCFCWTDECSKNFPPESMKTMDAWKDKKIIKDDTDIIGPYKKWTDASKSSGTIVFNTFFTLEIVVIINTLFSGISSSWICFMKNGTKNKEQGTRNIGSLSFKNKIALFGRATWQKLFWSNCHTRAICDGKFHDEFYTFWGFSWIKNGSQVKIEKKKNAIHHEICHRILY